METFESEAFKVEATKSTGCKLSMNVMISPIETKKAYKKAVRQVNKQISVPGFRKGKAPDNTVVSKYGSYVDQEWKDILIQVGVEQGLHLSKIYPLRKGLDGRPKVGLCCLEEGAEISFSYEHYPDVPTIDFSKLSIPEIEKEPYPESKVDEVLFEVRRSHADWEAIEGRSAAENDYANISVRTVEPDMSIIENRRVPLEEGHIAPWIMKALIGMNLEEVKETLTEGEKPSKVRVTLHTLWKIILPEVNDDLAIKVGAESKEDLLKKIHHNLENEALDNLQIKKIQALEEALVEVYKFDVPASLLASEREVRIKEKIAEMKKQQLSDEEIKTREAEIEQEIATLVDKSLHLFFLNKQIAKQGNVAVSQKELNDELVHQMARNPAYFQQGMSQGSTEQMVERLSSVLIERKTKEYALSQLTNS